MSNFILQLLINLFVLAGGYFVGKRKERWKFTQEIKQRHLKEIQEQVFQPLLEILKNHWFPILERKRVNLQIEPIKKYNENIVVPEPVSFEYTLSTYEEPSCLKPLNPHLYKDAIDNHYTQILRKYEAFKLNSDKYIKDCFSLAKEIKIKILKMANLPEYNPFPSKDRNIWEEEWIISGRLAIFVIRRQLVPNDKDLTLKIEENYKQPSTLKLIKDTSYEDIALCGNPNEIIEVLIELSNKNDKTNELVSLAEKLRIDCLDIKEEIEKLCLSPKLIGDCELIKF